MATPASPELASAKVARRAATPVAGAIAGIIFAVLFTVSTTLLRQSMGDVAFFSTVFIGSGLLFLAMIFAAAATAGAIVAAAANDPVGFASSTTYDYARQTVTQILAVYALRMAAIFQLSQASLWLRTRVMPRWMALVTIVVALLLLFVFTQSWWNRGGSSWSSPGGCCWSASTSSSRSRRRSGGSRRSAEAAGRCRRVRCRSPWKQASSRQQAHGETSARGQFSDSNCNYWR